MTDPSVIYTFSDFYRDIAEYFHLAGVAPYDAPDVHFQNAMDRIVDISNVDHSGHANLTVIKLLEPMYRLLQHSRRRVAVDAMKIRFVKAINNFVIRYINPDLTEFINTSVGWVGGFVPPVWVDESTAAGFDTTGWLSTS